MCHVGISASPLWVVLVVLAVGSIVCRFLVVPFLVASIIILSLFFPFFCVSGRRRKASQVSGPAYTLILSWACGKCLPRTANEQACMLWHASLGPRLSLGQCAMGQAVRLFSLPCFYALAFWRLSTPPPLWFYDGRMDGFRVKDGRRVTYGV